MSTRVFEARRRDLQNNAKATGAAWRSVVLPLRVTHEKSLAPAALSTTTAQDTRARVEDRQFVEMSHAYEAHGGFASGDQIATQVGRHRDQPISVVARWIVRREIVNIVWHSHILIPRFQFTDVDMQIRSVVSRAIAELESVFDDWEIAQWFAQPNSVLRDRRPLDLLVVDEAAIVEAARVDRYIARG